jgi:hypothetical protein
MNHLPGMIAHYQRIKALQSLNAIIPVNLEKSEAILMNTSLALHWCKLLADQG